MDDRKDETAAPADQKSPDSGTSSQSPTTNSRDPQMDREALLEQARLFLLEDTISQAPVAEKKTFLKDKGLNEEEIRTLLESGGLEDSEDTPVAEASSTTDSSPIQSEDMSFADHYFEASSTSNASPPIVTYPEFLMNPPKPPMIPLSTLTSAAYLLGAISTLSYGANRFLVQPLLESLTDARHDINRSTLQNLEKFNAQLASAASHLPNEDKTTLFSNRENREIGSDLSSEISDPTELFHRDIGIQTTPTLLRTPHQSGSTTPDHPESPLNAQVKTVENLRTKLSALRSLSEPTPATDEPPLLTALASTTQSLASLSRPDFSRSQAPRGASIIQTIPSTPGDSSLTNDDSRTNGLSSNFLSEGEDQAAIFRAEIRALKGVVLGARKIPAPPPVKRVGKEVDVKTEEDTDDET